MSWTLLLLRCFFDMKISEDVLIEIDLENTPNGKKVPIIADYIESPADSTFSKSKEELSSTFVGPIVATRVRTTSGNDVLDIDR
jgi:hypothetical protein